MARHRSSGNLNTTPLHLPITPVQQPVVTGTQPAATTITTTPVASYPKKRSLPADFDDSGLGPRPSPSARGFPTQPQLKHDQTQHVQQGSSQPLPPNQQQSQPQQAQQSRKRAIAQPRKQRRLPQAQPQPTPQYPAQQQPTLGYQLLLQQVALPAPAPEPQPVFPSFDRYCQSNGGPLIDEAQLFGYAPPQVSDHCPQQLLFQGQDQPLYQQQLYQQQLYQHQQQLTPQTPALDYNVDFLLDSMLPTPTVSPTEAPMMPPGSFPQQAQQQPLQQQQPQQHQQAQPSPTAMPVVPLVTAGPSTSPQPAPARRSIYTNRYIGRPARTTQAAAAALSVAHGTSSSAAFTASPSSSSLPHNAQSSPSNTASFLAVNGPHQPQGTRPPPVLRVGGFTLAEAGIRLPPSLSPEERARRMELLRQELAYEEQHPPVLPPSKVPDLPPKPPQPKLPKTHDGMTTAQRDAVFAEVRRLTGEMRTADQSRNNEAAKKSRCTRVEQLRNTRKQLNAKAAECSWLRLQLIALAGVGGDDVGAMAPSEAWGGFRFVYRGGPPAPETSPAALMAMDDEEEEDEEDGDEDEDEEAGDDEGEDGDVRMRRVPVRVKQGMTEEMAARVARHDKIVEDLRKKKEAEKRLVQRRQRAEEKRREKEAQK